MNATRWSDRTRRMLVLGFLGATLACSVNQPGTSVVVGSQSEGIPAPASSLTDASPAEDFFRYGDSLRFATDTPGTVLFSRVVNGVTAELRVRSELRLPLTPDSAYVQGRIVAKFETVGANSPYNTPVGNAYLWVRDTGGGNLRGTLIWRDYVTGRTGNTAVPYYRHSSRSAQVVSRATCENFSSATLDTVRLCCLCSDGRFNCPMMHDLSVNEIDELLRRAGRVP